jgi:hypothetical protein
MFDRKVAMAALVSSIVGFGLPAFADDNVFNDFTQPTFGGGAAEGETYVDPQFASRRNCLEHPAKPAWAMDHSFRFRWRIVLAVKYNSRRQGRLISETETCTCDILYPDWNEMRPEIEEMWARVSDLPSNKWTSEIKARYVAENDIFRKENYSFMVGRLCGNPE